MKTIDSPTPVRRCPPGRWLVRAGLTLMWLGPLAYVVQLLAQVLDPLRMGQGPEAFLGFVLLHGEYRFRVQSCGGASHCARRA